MTSVAREADIACVELACSLLDAVKEYEVAHGDVPGLLVLHGLAGVGLIALVIVHVYFALRPEKLAITYSMIFGTMTREFYLDEYDPERWVIKTDPSSGNRPGVANAD